MPTSASPLDHTLMEKKATAVSAAVTGLVPGSNYLFRIVAVSGDVQAAASPASVSAHTPASLVAPVMGLASSTVTNTATDASGKALTVHVLNAPATHRRPANKDFAAGYINFYVCNGAVIMPQFGDTTADAAARSKLQELYPGRSVIPLDIDAIAAGGGGIHCTTQQEPRY